MLIWKYSNHSIWKTASASSRRSLFYEARILASKSIIGDLLQIDLRTVDEKSYEPGRASMGTDHPLIWWHCVGKGHALYSALGHAAETYPGPLMIRLLENSID